MIGCPVSDSSDRSRRRRWYSNATIPSESMPLEVDARGKSPNYLTFRQNKQQDLLPYYLCMLPTIPWCDDSCKYRKRHRPLYGGTPGQNVYRGTSGRSQPLCCSSKAFYGLLFLTGLWFVYHNHHSQEPRFYHHHPYSPPESQWDHNIYAPFNPDTLVGDGDNIPETNPPDDSSKGRAFLVAQLGGSSGLDSLTDISSRPNRAYARQHGMDYVRYARGGRSHTKTCFDKVILLNTILDNQLRDSTAAPLPSIFSLPLQVEYDAVALLSPDSIVTNLDYNIFDMMPKDKLVAIAGWKDYDSTDDDNNNNNNEEQSSLSSLTSATDIMFFNLRHKHANAVAKLWWDLAEPKEVTCGAGNDLNLLLDAFSFVLGEDEDISSQILSLKETDEGFVLDRGKEGDTDNPGQQEQVLKGVMPSLPESRAYMLLSSLADVKVELQTTADSVCYRYYPRCEVL